MSRNYAFAMKYEDGALALWSVKPTARQAREMAVMGLPASCPQEWIECFKRGWRIVKVEVREAGK